MDNPQKSDSQNNKEKARQLYEEGARAWKNGERALAISLYNKSALLDPEGAGAVALKMSNKIMNFFDPNQFNP